MTQTSYLAIIFILMFSNIINALDLFIKYIVIIFVSNKLVMTNDELKILQELRSDLFYQIEAKFGPKKASNYHSIVKADKLIKNNDVVPDDAVNFVEWMDVVCIRDGRFEWKYQEDNYKKKHTTKEMYAEWLKLTEKI